MSLTKDVMTNSINNRNAYLGYVKSPLLDCLSDRVEYTDNPFNFVEFKELQKICREPFRFGTKEYRALSKNKIIELMVKDPRWKRKLMDCRMTSSNYDTSLRVNNVIICLRLK